MSPAERVGDLARKSAFRGIEDGFHTHRPALSHHGDVAIDRNEGSCASHSQIDFDRIQGEQVVAAALVGFDGDCRFVRQSVAGAQGDCASFQGIDRRRGPDPLFHRHLKQVDTHGLHVLPEPSVPGGETPIRGKMCDAVDAGEYGRMRPERITLYPQSRIQGPACGFQREAGMEGGLLRSDVGTHEPGEFRFVDQRPRRVTRDHFEGGDFRTLIQGATVFETVPDGFEAGIQREERRRRPRAAQSRPQIQNILIETLLQFIIPLFADLLGEYPVGQQVAFRGLKIEVEIGAVDRDRAVARQIGLRFDLKLLRHIPCADARAGVLPGK
ncbi:MAG: hypothetical protein EBU57_05265 [Alphaproteobacteria bacterium]|nr:hypothetical protein [Alphaproteobacteria bacterium]